MSISVSYSRVSTLMEQQQRSLKAQQEQWEEIIDKEGDTIANCGIFYKKNGKKQPKNGMYVDEGISGKDYKHRLAFLQMIEDGIQNKFKKIYVEDTSRFARCTEDGMKIVKDLREKGVNVYFRKENINSIDPNNDMLLTVLFASAEKENQMKSERFKWMFNKVHSKGGWSSRAPYGYIVKNTILSVNEKERPIVDLIFYLYTEMLLGMRAIANELNRRNIKSKTGELWKHSTIKYILDNRMYIGDIVNHKTESFDITRGTYRKIPEEEQIVVHNEKLRIISDETWKKKDEIKQKRNEKLKNREGHSSKHELSTLLYCDQCKSTYIRVKSHIRRKNAEKKYVWTCLGHNHYGNFKCKGRTSLEEKSLLNCIKKELTQKQKMDDEYVFDLYKKNKEEQLDKINIKELKDEKENINIQMIELRTEKNKKMISIETYEEQIQHLNEKLKNIRAEINKYNNITAEIEKAKEEYDEQKKLIETIDFNNLDNMTLKKIFDRIIVIVDEKNDKKYITLDFRYNFLNSIEEDIRSENGTKKCLRYYRGFNYSDASCLLEEMDDNKNSRIMRKLKSLQMDIKVSK